MNVIKLKIEEVYEAATSPFRPKSPTGFLIRDVDELVEQYGLQEDVDLIEALEEWTSIKI